VVLVCCMQEHTRVSEKRSQRQFPNPVLAYVTPWCAISAILCMLVEFAFISGYMYCCTIQIWHLRSLYNSAYVKMV
jgi:hypothetical protein